MIDELIVEQFEQELSKWAEHCNYNFVGLSSNPNIRLQCDAYHNIVTMGTKILPLIRTAYDIDSQFFPGIEEVKAFGLFQVVDAICKDFSIPTELEGKMTAMQDYTKNWLDNNMRKYV
jgi:hypothetical protein